MDRMRAATVYAKPSRPSYSLCILCAVMVLMVSMPLHSYRLDQFVDAGGHAVRENVSPVGRRTEDQEFEDQITILRQARTIDHLSMSISHRNATIADLQAQLAREQRIQCWQRRFIIGCAGLGAGGVLLWTAVHGYRSGQHGKSLTGDYRPLAMYRRICAGISRLLNSSTCAI